LGIYGHKKNGDPNKMFSYMLSIQMAKNLAVCKRAHCSAFLNFGIPCDSATIK
jgi:hypothetical protein